MLGFTQPTAKTIIELLDINPEQDQIEMEVEGKVMKIKKAENGQEETLHRSGINLKYYQI